MRVHRLKCNAWVGGGRRYLGNRYAGSSDYRCLDSLAYIENLSFIFFNLNTNTQWPSDAVPVILADFDDEQHVEDNQMTTTTTSVGDRRQEIVFIGLELGRREWQLEICKSLDQCLLNDEEWSTYQQLKGDENALRLRFANSVKSQMLTY